MDSIINLNLMKNPMNWIIVILMVLLAFIGAEIIFNKFSKEGK